MRITKTFVSGALGSLLVGFVLTAFVAASSRSPIPLAFLEDSNRALEWLVPAGSLGDEIGYEMAARANGGDWVADGGYVVKVNSTARVLDETGFLHEALSVMERRSPGASYVSQLYVDLTTRETLRRDHGQDYGEDVAISISDFGPRLDNGWFEAPDGSLFWLQGQSFSLGDDVTEALRPRFLNQWGFHDDGADLSDFRSWIAAAGEVAGQPAIELRTEGTARFSVRPEEEWEGRFRGSEPDGRTPFLSFLVPLDATVEFSRSAWVNTSVPYPVLVTDRIVLNGSGAREAVHTLVGHKKGASAIPWGGDVDVPHYAAFNSHLDRTPGNQTHPADGLRSELCYPLSEAIRKVERDSANFSGFHAWRQAFPEYYLVGADTADCGITDYPAWFLLFAHPSGEAFYVHVWQGTVELYSHGFFSALTDGRYTVPPFDAAAIPRNLVSIAEAERLFARLASADYAKKPISHVHWGLYAFDSSIPTGDVTRAVEGDARDLSRLSVGYWGEADDDPSTIEAFAGIQASTGLILWFYEARCVECWPSLTDPAHLIETVGSLAARSDASQANPTAAPRTPVYGLAALVSASILTLFLVVYFYPLLKFLGTQALALVPGYAKLRKDAILDNATREQLVSLIRVDPGISPPELASRIAAGWSTIVYHLDVLEKNQLVSSLIDGRHKRFFPVERVDWSKRGQLAALRNERTKAVYELLADEPGLPRGAIAHRFGCSVSSAIWHLTRLEAAGLAGHDKTGRRVRYYANPAGIAPRPLDPLTAVEVA